MYEQHIQTAIERTRTMVHRYYCENDVDAVIAQMSEDIIWLGAGEQEYAAILAVWKADRANQRLQEFKEYLHR